MAVVREGYLMKQGHFVRNWKRRFFQLSSRELRYFDSPDKPPKLRVALASISEVFDGDRPLLHPSGGVPPDVRRRHGSVTVAAVAGNIATSVAGAFGADGTKHVRPDLVAQIQWVVPGNAEPGCLMIAFASAQDKALWITALFQARQKRLSMDGLSMVQAGLAVGTDEATAPAPAPVPAPVPTPPPPSATSPHHAPRPPRAHVSPTHAARAVGTAPAAAAPPPLSKASLAERLGRVASTVQEGVRMGAVIGTQRDTHTFRDHLRRTMEDTFTELSAVNSGIRTLMSRVPPDSPDHTFLAKLGRDTAHVMKSLVALREDLVPKLRRTTPRDSRRERAPPRAQASTAASSGAGGGRGHHGQPRSGQLSQQLAMADDQAVDNAELEIAEAIARERAHEIDEVSRDAVELKGLFEEVAHLVDEQGEMLDHIETNVDSAHARVTDGVNYLIKAEARQTHRDAHYIPKPKPAGVRGQHTTGPRSAPAPSDRRGAPTGGFSSDRVRGSDAPIATATSTRREGAPQDSRGRRASGQGDEKCVVM